MRVVELTDWKLDSELLRITLIYIYIYIYNVINPKISFPHLHNSYSLPLFSLFSLVLLSHSQITISLTLNLTFGQLPNLSPPIQAFAATPSSVSVTVIPQAILLTSTSRDQAPLLKDLTLPDPPPPHKATTHSSFSPRCELKILH